MRIACGGLLALLVSCTTANTNKECSAGSCNDPAFPYCDIEGVISGEAGTCIAVTCTPGEIKTCLGDEALTCNAAGDGYEHVPCELGCKPEPTPHCGYIEPRYVPDICDAPATNDLTISSSGIFDPNLDSNCNGGVVAQPGAPSICVVHYRRISILADIELRVLGKVETVNVEYVGRPLALIADEDLLIAGALDLSAHGFVNGPGAGMVLSGGTTLVMSPTVHVAAGGAGAKTAGAAGGSSSADGGAANGGMAAAAPAFLNALLGGAAAYRGNTGNVARGGGGGGGGATLVSCRGAVNVTGTINAGGGGGSGGGSALGVGAPGTAGGAGGYVVLQGKHISVTGGLYANGGGGGAGVDASLADGADGQDGAWSATNSASGGIAQNGSGRGGHGGVGTQQPTVGGKPTMTGATAGGGGGSVGFLQTYTPEGIEPTLSGQSSPAFQPNATIKTR